MAFTPQDLAAINAAIASGELMIRAADGKTVTLRTMDELLKARDTILADMPVPLGAGATDEVARNAGLHRATLYRLMKRNPGA